MIDEITHQKFKRGLIIPEIGKPNENNLLIEVKLTLEESLCGFEKVFTHLDNKLFKFSMTDTVKHGDIYVMKGFGMPIYNEESRFGDLLIKISIEQKKLTSQQKGKIWEILSNEPFKEIKKQSNIINFNDYKHEAVNNEKQESMKNKYRRRQQFNSDDDIDDDEGNGHPNVQCAQQ
jgi:DnaJ-class molecular chaperone